MGFRATAFQTASGYRVTGFVRNEPDGSVWLEAQGAEAEVRAFVGAVAERLGRYITSSASEGAGVVGGEARFVIQR